MSVLDVTLTKPKSADRLLRSRRKARATSILRCLIASADGRRLDEWTQVVSASGWDVVSCSDGEATRKVVQRETFQLVFLDLEHAGDEVASNYHACGKWLAINSDGLLVVCGGVEDPREEIWARKVGTWFYLPGVVGSDAIQTLCGEARTVVEKQTQRKRSGTTPFLMA